MSVAELIARIAKAHVPGYRRGGRLEVTPDGGLEYVGPEEILTDDARRFIRDHRDEILTFLRSPIDYTPRSHLAFFDYQRTLSKADFDWIDNAVWGNPPGVPTP